MIATNSGGKSSEPLLRVADLTQRFRVKGGDLEAVSNISLEIRKGESVGLVGESGSGKTSLGRAILQLPPPTRGSVRLDGDELVGISRRRLRGYRSHMALVFQDPVSALNPRRSVYDIVGESFMGSGLGKSAVRLQIDELLTMVGLDPTAVGNSRPRNLSGGQCQRVAIARALAVRPKLMVCDEPVASLDVSVQGQVLNLLQDAREQFGLALLFISHDLAVVHVVSDRIAVMYLGRIVEFGTADQVTRHPAHPYTRALLDAVPTTDPDSTPRPTSLRGEIPSPLDPPSGCSFRTRCPLAQDRCAAETPVLQGYGYGHRVACHYPLDTREKL